MVNDTTKFCPQCQSTLPVERFPRNKARHDGLGGYCKPCQNSRIKDYYKANPAKVTERNRRHNEKNPDYFLKLRYGIDMAGYDALVAQQGNRCAICRTDDPSGKNGKWCVDHDHATGVVRGLLCVHCNLAIGQMGDEPERLRAAASYLESNTQKVGHQ